jgi:hypothetical protein
LQQYKLKLKHCITKNKTKKKVWAKTRGSLFM